MMHAANNNVETTWEREILMNIVQGCTGRNREIERERETEKETFLSNSRKVYPGPVIHPNISQTSIVSRNNSRSTSTGETIRSLLAKHVANVRTRRYQQGTTAHPYLSGKKG